MPRAALADCGWCLIGVLSWAQAASAHEMAASSLELDITSGALVGTLRVANTTLARVVGQAARDGRHEVDWFEKHAEELRARVDGVVTLRVTDGDGAERDVACEVVDVASRVVHDLDFETTLTVAFPWCLRPTRITVTCAYLCGGSESRAIVAVRDAATQSGSSGTLSALGRSLTWEVPPLPMAVAVDPADPSVADGGGSHDAASRSRSLCAGAFAVGLFVFHLARRLRRDR